jgi:GNAT superfamily N-acetyltransferase
LVAQSEVEGFRFLGRLREEWDSGLNRFTGVGEALFGVYDDICLVAVGGITRSSHSAGRLRRCYVDQGYRRRGVGRLLVGALLEHARHHFVKVQLRTDTAIADAFYRSLGFTRACENAEVSHEISVQLPNQSLEPTSTSVTIPAGAGFAPAVDVAQH